MPVLLLARGDKTSRNLLKQAIEARYGPSAPMIESVKIDLKGKTRVKLPFTTTWMQMDATVVIKFPSAIRWDFTMRTAGLPVTTTSEAFDGEALRRTRMLLESAVNTDTDLLHSSRARLWTLAVLLLTPLSDPAILVRAIDNRTLEVENTETGIHCQLVLNDDITVNQVTTACFNPVNERKQVYRLRVADGQVMINNLMVPRRIDVLWDDELESELTPVHVEPNITLEENFFRI